MPSRKQHAPKHTPEVVRNRVKELRTVLASELRGNDRNWRVHPYAQRRALAESLELVGIADALVAYESPRNGGKLTLIDGHLRADEADTSEWPVLVLDVDDDEADMLLTTLDPLAAMATIDADRLAALLGKNVGAGGPALQDMMAQLARDAEDVDMEELAGAIESTGPPEMELQAFEHYEYVVLLYRNALDWSRAREIFELREEAFTLRDGVTRKIGFGRVVDGRRLFALVDVAPE